MKNTVEPILAIIGGFISWKAWNALLITMIMAVVLGALGFLGKYLMQRAISRINNRKNKPL